ncbi:MAG: heme-dependent oxidative N-demethylase subunit alpha family protein, partial [Pseudomonadota bacterium]
MQKRGHGWLADLAKAFRPWQNHPMTAILHRHLPDDMRITRALPGIRPETGPWLRVDEAYGAQMARREALLQAQADDVLYLEEAARPAAEELLALVLSQLPTLGYAVKDDAVWCPDGRQVHVDGVT